MKFGIKRLVLAGLLISSTSLFGITPLNQMKQYLKQARAGTINWKKISTLGPKFKPVINVGDQYGVTLLMFAASPVGQQTPQLYQDTEAAAHYLVETLGADKSIKSDFGNGTGWTASQYATNAVRPKLAVYLLQKSN
ncbi:hypothetical protein A3F06_04115 [candidate division TM6 bacterium RIFCSPHIGHO2_12_FULL_36_22]|nr:MAG: hypothetical protein A3F06_04115 [candidate division TM6 bacterium RIFCSPHIGHO2_12_FULL_36_22]HLB43289.1 hypothetical protein [Gammaproteobacteria bacterium]